MFYRQLMEELAHYIYRTPPTNHNEEWKNEQLWRWVWLLSHVMSHVTYIYIVYADIFNLVSIIQVTT